MEDTIEALLEQFMRQAKAPLGPDPLGEVLADIVWQRIENPPDFLGPKKDG
jgi:hypothetical protein